MTNILKLLACVLLGSAMMLAAPVAMAGGSHYMCEKELKSGKHKVLKKIKSKRKCKKIGGTWVKHDENHDHDHGDHDHDHDHDDHDHSHTH